MITIRKFAIYAAIAYIASLFAALVVVRWVVFFPQEMSYTLQIQQKDLNSLKYALAADASELSLTTDDYAQWDDTWHFIQTPNGSYEDVNFIAETFASLNVNFAMLLDMNKDPVFSKFYDGEDVVELDLKRSQELLKEDTQRLFSSATNISYELADGRLYLVVVSPVLRSDESGPQRGWLVFARFIDEQYVAMMAERTQLEIAQADTIGDNIILMAATLNDVALQRHVCLNNTNSAPVFCLQLLHDEHLIPKVMSMPSVVSFLLLSIFPLAIAMIVMRWVFMPIFQATEFFKHQDVDNLQKLNIKTRIKEMADLARIYNEIIRRLHHHQERLKKSALTDALTGIANRSAFSKSIEQTWRRLTHRSSSTAVVMVDIDFFKRYNDHYGHQQGDHALMEVARALKNCAGRQDEVCARYGGEEFILIVYLDDAEDLNRFRLHLIDSIRKLNIRHEYSTVSEQLTISFGIAWIRHSGEWLKSATHKQWVKEADEALYDAKAAGRNQGMVRVFSQDMPLS
jgi:diguanylate cyclase (GGDEF)-like protein